MAVNGSVAGGTTGTTNFTAYISPYLVVNNGGLYTKHLYVGSQRVMSKLASSDIFAVNPTDASVSKATYTGNTLNFATKYNTLTATVKARYDSLGVVYNGVPQTGGLVSNSPSGVGGQYYYHSDHLGSASYITDANGDVSQHLEYIPDGTCFVDERNSTWHSPFLFNGKEQDEETGLKYYSSRYYDSNGWLTPDDHKEKYPNIGAYVYCFGNPVKYRDPDGKDPVSDYATAAGVLYGTQVLSAEAAATGVGVVAVPYIEAGGVAVSIFYAAKGFISSFRKSSSNNSSAETNSQTESSNNSAQSSAASPEPKKEDEKNKNDDNRSQAQRKAKEHSKVPRDSKGGENIDLNELNESSRGKNYEGMKERGAKSLGRKNPNGLNKFEEHPDGHPKSSGDAPHHDNGHFHSINPKGESKIFPYKK